MNIKEQIQKIDFINHMYTDFKWRERKISYGNDNKDKIFYVVRRANAKVGLFSLVLTNLGYIKYALDRGYIPVVDMQNYGQFFQGGNADTQNMWEYYFEQPCGYSVEHISKSKSVILGNGIISGEITYPSDELAYDDKKLSHWKTVARDYLMIKDDIVKEANILAKDLFRGNRILGVLARGTDYINARPLNHPVQPMPEQLMEKIDQVLVEQKCDKIYLATEDADIFAKFKDKYGKDLIAMDVERYVTKEKENINDIQRQKVKDNYLVARAYLINMLLLSKCNCLVAGNTSGSLGALLLNEKYEYKYIFNLGVYE